MAHLLRPLFEGPIDLIGDIHGEFGAMERLLALLGYPASGAHPEGRRLVFLGDLVDRGPDSIAVVRTVRELMERGLADCVLGNHELNLLLEKRREGNEWFWGETQELREGGRVPQALADDATREELRAFLRQLPLLLERSDLRAVHAAWHPSMKGKLSLVSGDAAAVFRKYERRINASLSREGIALNSHHADLRRQNLNPVTVATSGFERPTPTPFWAGGRLRKVERVAWWQDYRDRRAIVFGHYWRALAEEARPVKAGPYLFAGTDPEQALGPRQNAYCVDFSVGHRNIARTQGQAYGLDNALVALRYPEMELVFDRGDARPVSFAAQASSAETISSASDSSSVSS